MYYMYIFTSLDIIDTHGEAPVPITPFLSRPQDLLNSPEVVANRHWIFLWHHEVPALKESTSGNWQPLWHFKVYPNMSRLLGTLWPTIILMQFVTPCMKQPALLYCSLEMRFNSLSQNRSNSTESNLLLKSARIYMRYICSKMVTHTRFAYWQCFFCRYGLPISTFKYKYH